MYYVGQCNIANVTLQATKTEQFRWNEQQNQWTDIWYPSIYHHITHTYIKNETFFVELKVFCVGLGFLFRCSKLHSELSWRNKMDGNYGKKVHCGHKQRQRNACKFYFMHSNLHNESWMWCGRTENVPLNATSSNNWLEIRCNETKNQGWMKTNKIQFYLVFCSIFPVSSALCSMNLLSSVICWS